MFVEYIKAYKIHVLPYISDTDTWAVLTNRIYIKLTSTRSILKPGSVHIYTHVYMHQLRKVFHGHKGFALKSVFIYTFIQAEGSLASSNSVHTGPLKR